MKGLASLSEREKQVAEMVAWGFTEKEIAEKIHVSPLTVNTHKKNIYREMGIRKDTDLAREFFLQEYGIRAVSPFAKAAMAGLFLLISLFSIAENHDMLRQFRSQNITARTVSARPARSSRRKEVFYLTA